LVILVIMKTQAGKRTPSREAAVEDSTYDGPMWREIDCDDPAVIALTSPMPDANALPPLAL